MLFRPGPHTYLPLALLTTMAWCWGEKARAATKPDVEFNRDIRPLLSDACFRCHGPDQAERKAGLRLDTPEGVATDLGGYRAVVPGSVATSELWKRITAHDADDAMPPSDAARQLSAAEKERLRTWIEQGAHWQPHWSLVPPVKAKVSRQSRSAIDAFVSERLKREHLAPLPPAPWETLLRRATLDLTGLPPSKEARARLQHAPQKPTFEREIDRLLASPQFGERMAADWLTAARYADTNGYQKDNDRQMWRYRDWVIDAFNNNQPFDQFTIEQLAGDLLPKATTAQKIATGFNRNHRTNDEGGIIAEEYRVEYVVDRVETLGAVWLGMTLGCSRCHDHKYDPISQKDFYRLFAYFNNVEERGRSGGSSIPPFMLAPTSQQEMTLSRLEKRLSEAERRLRQLDTPSAFAAWRSANTTVCTTPIADLLRRFAFDGSHVEAVSGETPAEAAVPEAFSAGVDNTALSLENGQPVRLGPAMRIDGRDRVTLSFWIYPTKVDGAILGRMSSENASSWRAGFGAFLQNGKLSFALGSRWLDDSLRVHTRAPLALRQWHHATIRYDGSQRAAGISISLDGLPVTTDVDFDELVTVDLRPDDKRDPLVINALPEMPGFNGRLDDLQLFQRVLTDDEVAELSAAEPVAQLIAKSPSQLSPQAHAKLHRCYLNTGAPTAVRAAYRQRMEAQSRRDVFVSTLPTTMIMQDRKERRPTFVLARGQYDRPTEEIDPGVPSAFSPERSVGTTRLDLARWVVSRNNPLTARVFVNRLWKMLFGNGLVTTVEDLGAQGSKPSHPELLDWLAVDFMEHGWNVKRLVKSLILTEVYQRSSNAPTELRDRDPQNHLLAYASRVRLPAEALHDQVLSTSELLDLRSGGPSVTSGHRRGLYQFWQRTRPPAFFSTFDAPTRDTCVVSRGQTNTPLQALALFNEPLALEAAQRLSQTLLAEPFRTNEDRVRALWERIVGRSPSTTEQTIATKHLLTMLSHFHDQRGDAQAFSATAFRPVLAAGYTSLALLLFNLDETLTRN